MEMRLELRARVNQMMRRVFEMRAARETPGEIRERDVDSFDLAIRQQPFAIAHVGVDET